MTKAEIRPHARGYHCPAHCLTRAAMLGVAESRVESLSESTHILLKAVYQQTRWVAGTVGGTRSRCESSTVT